jgi:adenylate kinase
MNKLPNILVCGTPGTGKSTFCQSLIQEFPQQLRHIDISEMVKNDARLHEGYDEESGAFIINDDAVVDMLESYMEQGGIVVDTHSLIDYFPERWFSLVLVLKTNNTVLYDRLIKRGYPQAKITENVECEIMQVVEDEARESCAEGIVQVLESDNVNQLEDNVERTATWLKENFHALR